MTCEHLSASGIDRTSMDDPAKVWRCDECRKLIRFVEQHSAPHTTLVVEVDA